MKKYLQVLTIALLTLAGAGIACPKATLADSLFDGANKKEDATTSATPQPVLAVPTLLSDTTAIVPGQKFRLGVLLTVEPGWHIYYKDPGEIGKPTVISMALPARFKTDDLVWPAPETFSQNGLTTYGYEGSPFLWSSIAPSSSLHPGDQVKLQVSVEFLACKNICVPGSAQTELVLPVVATLGQAKAANSDKFANLNGLLDRLSGSPDSASLGMLWALIGAFLGGMVLNLMPCVLPVLLMKVRRLLLLTGHQRRDTIRDGLAFTSGTVAAFQVLAMIIIGGKLAGHVIGWGFQFQQPLFLIGMSALMTVLALSLFGLFYVQVTAGSEELDELARSKGGYGAFFEGVLATLLSTPCTAPLLGTALGFAFGQPWYAVLLVFFSIGLGLSFPYLLLSCQPSLVAWLPKPGAWMEHLKELMGFGMLATVVWLLSVLGNMGGAELLSRTLAVLLVACLSAWIIARFSDGTGKRRIAAWTVALVLAAVSVWLLLVPALATKPVAAASTVESFSAQALEKHLTNGEVVLVDFTADWCLTCKVNEKVVLGSTTVENRMNSMRAVLLRADWTDGDEKITKLITKFGRSGVPLYVIFSPARPEQPLVLPEVLTVQSVIDGLQTAAQK